MATNKRSKTKSNKARKKSTGLRLPRRINKWQALLMVAVVVAIGGFFVYRSFAYSPTAPCSSGSKDAGYAKAYKNGKDYKIRLCRIQWFQSTGSEDGGWVRVAANASGNWVGLLRAAYRDDVTLIASSSFRSWDKQVALRRANCGTSYNDIYHKNPNDCRPATAKPGYSNHQSGEAVDLLITPGNLIPGTTKPLTLGECLKNYKNYHVYHWLSKNAHKYNRFARIGSECWHWSPTGL